MTASRALVIGVAALSAAGASIDPSVRPAERRPRAVIAAEAVVVKAAEEIAPTSAPAPADLRVEALPDGRGGHRVAIRRAGFLVSLRSEGARAAGDGLAAINLASPKGARAGRARLIWETTDPVTLQTTRGLLRVEVRDGEAVTSLASATPPEPAGQWKSKRATCAAHRDGFGGFTVICRFAKGTQHLGVANVTGAHALEDAFITSGPVPLARLDLPRREGGAEGRIIGFSSGLTGVALRAEATFPEGEPGALLLEESERAQPRPVF